MTTTPTSHCFFSQTDSLPAASGDVFRRVIFWRCATKPRSSRTSCGGTQTPTSSPFANSRARIEAAILSVITCARVISATCGGCTTITDPTYAESSSYNCQVLVVISRTTSSCLVRFFFIQLSRFDNSTRRAGMTTSKF